MVIIRPTLLWRLLGAFIKNRAVHYFKERRRRLWCSAVNTQVNMDSCFVAVRIFRFSNYLHYMRLMRQSTHYTVHANLSKDNWRLESRSFLNLFQYELTVTRILTIMEKAAMKPLEKLTQPYYCSFAIRHSGLVNRYVLVLTMMRLQVQISNRANLLPVKPYSLGVLKYSVQRLWLSIEGFGSLELPANLRLSSVAISISFNVCDAKCPTSVEAWFLTFWVITCIRGAKTVNFFIILSLWSRSHFFKCTVEIQSYKH
jgi:hypothetical protein